MPLKAAALQFPLLHPAHLAVIPGGQNIHEMQSNIDSLNVDIPTQLWESLKNANLLDPDSIVS